MRKYRLELVCESGADEPEGTSMFARYNITDTRDQVAAFERLEKHLAAVPKTAKATPIR